MIIWYDFEIDYSDFRLSLRNTSGFVDSRDSTALTYFKTQKSKRVIVPISLSFLGSETKGRTLLL